MRAVAVVLCLLLVLVVVAEVATRRVLDGAVATAAEVGLRRASQDGQGFAEVSGDARGWALPDLLSGRVSGVDVEAADGELSGLPVRRLTATAGEVDLGDRLADGVVVVATADPLDLLGIAQELAGDLSGIDLAAGQVTAAGPDLLRVTGTVQERPLVADVRIAADGAGGLAATVVGVQVGEEALVASLLPRSGGVLLSAERLPAGFRVTSAAVRGAQGGPALIDVTLECPGRCDLAAVAARGAAAVTVRA